MQSTVNQAFGWSHNATADGFEQDHGRFTIEVFYSDNAHKWSWTVWGSVQAEGKTDQVQVMNGWAKGLADAKRLGLSAAMSLEKELATATIKEVAR